MLQPNDIITVTERTDTHDPPIGASFVVRTLSQYYVYVHWLSDTNYPLKLTQVRRATREAACAGQLATIEANVDGIPSECTLHLIVNGVTHRLRGTLEGHVEGVDTSKPFVVDLGQSWGRGS